VASSCQSPRAMKRQLGFCPILRTCSVRTHRLAADASARGLAPRNEQRQGATTRLSSAQNTPGCSPVQMSPPEEVSSSRAKETPAEERSGELPDLGRDPPDRLNRSLRFSASLSLVQLVGV
jgi:hypothetical protein